MPRTSNNVHSQTAVQIQISWGDNPIFVTELNPPRNFSIGEQGCDFTVPSEQLGASRIDLLMVSGSELRVEGMEGMLMHGSTARVTRGQLVFEVSAGAPEDGVARAFGDGEWGTAAGYFGASFASVGAILAAAAFMVPPSGLTEGEMTAEEQLIAIQQYLNADAEKETERQEAETGEAEKADNGGSGARAEGQEGQMGKPEAKRANATWSKQGPKDNPEPELSRLEAARSFGMIGLLSAGELGDPDAPTAPWGRDNALGADEMSAMGNMWGDTIGEAGGQNGLGLMGLSDGGGGPYRGIGLGRIGTLGRGDGTCIGADCQGFGSDRGRVKGDHATTGVSVRTAPPQVSGRIPPEVIQRRVRQNFGRFRLCYEKGLMRNPNLEGRVSVRFLISSDGSVANAASGGSSLPDATVTDCVVRAFYGISFPKPDVGSVSVNYPIMFSPG